jgi:hypothetical protein
MALVVAQLILPATLRHALEAINYLRKDGPPHPRREHAHATGRFIQLRRYSKQANVAVCCSQLSLAL